jgi:hypothetical protein
MQANKIELTPEQKGVLAALSEETGESVAALIDQVLDALQERVRAAHATGKQDSHATDDTAKPVWEKIIEAGRRIPEEELKDLPTDLAANVDHYAYGLPKRFP